VLPGSAPSRQAFLFRFHLRFDITLLTLFPASLVPPEPVHQQTRGFTLIELVGVIAIIIALTVLLIPAFTSLKRGGEIAEAAFTVAGVLDQARTHALTNNTYVWVGIYEEDTTAGAPTNATPPYPGKGRVLLALVAANDGTTSCQDPASSTSNRLPLIPGQITQVGKLVAIENIHITDIGPPLSPASSPAPDPNSIAGRPDFPYTSGSPTYDYQNRINSDDPHSSFNQTLYPFVAQGYTFHKTVRFSPRGEANINGTYVLRRVAEIGLRPTHGAVVDLNSANVAAIQFSGVTGKCKVYRK
jgi:type II secretory pathway pseudopilin PulG